MSTKSQNSATRQENNETFVGIDVGQEELVVHILPKNEQLTVSNSDKGIRKLVKRFEKINPYQIVFEATGGLERNLLTTLAAHGMPVVVLNSRQARRLAEGLGEHAKTDRVDAKMLATIAGLKHFTPRPVPSGETLEMNDLVARKQQLIHMRAMERNRLHAATKKKLAAFILRSIQKSINAIKKQIAEIDVRIQAMIDANDDWSEKDKILRSVPGVGPKTAQVLISALPELGELNRKQIASLAGVAPFKDQSGKRTGESRIAGGRPLIRCTLFMTATSAIRKPGVFKSLFDRIRAQGKAYKVALVAVMRKLITVLNAMLKTKTHWSEHGVRSGNL